MPGKQLSIPHIGIALNPLIRVSTKHFYYVLLILFVSCSEQRIKDDTTSVLRTAISVNPVTFDSGELGVEPLLAEDWEVRIPARNKSRIDSINAIDRLEVFSNIEEAVALFQRNVVDARVIGYQLGEAKASIHLGVALYLNGQYAESVASYLNAIRIFEAANAIEDIVMVYGDLGYQMKRRDMARGKTYMRKAIRMAEQHGLDYPLSGLYDNYGVLQEMSDNLDSAFFYYDKALELKQEIEDTLGIPYSLNHLAGLFALKKEFSKARWYLLKSDKYREKETGIFGKLNNMVLWGDLYFQMDSLDSAIIMYKRVTEIPEAFENNYQVTYCFSQMASIYQKKGDYKNAFDNQRKFQTYKDSLLNIQTNAKIASLEIEYETEKKDRELIERQLKIKHRNALLVISGLIVLLLLVIGIVIYRQMILAMSRKELEIEAERSHISREMHDNIGTSLTSILYKAELIKRHLPKDRKKAEKILSILIDNTQESIEEVREVIWAVDKIDVNWSDFTAFIKQWGTTFFQSSEDISFRFTSTYDVDFIVNPKIKLNLLRIFQEVCSNILKYANAKSVQADLSVRKGVISMAVKDDGGGFEIEEWEEVKIHHLGLKNMETRVHELDGQIFIRTKPGSGTCVQVEIPIG